MLTCPGDIGYPNDGYILPELLMHEHLVDASTSMDDGLFGWVAKTLTERRDAITHDLVSGSGYKNLTDKQKAKALELAHEYAADQGKRAALEDYPDQSEWMAGIDGKEADAIVRKVNVDTLNGAIKDLTTAIANGWNYNEKAKNLKTAYDTLDKMTTDVRNDVLENATSDVQKYAEARGNGVSDSAYITALRRIAAQKPQSGFDKVRDAQTREAIAGAPLADPVIDKLMKAHLPDYDPNAKNKDTAELKYDYIRQEMGYSPAKYAAAYDIYSYEQSMKGEGMADRTRKRFQQELGISSKEAKLLYKLLNGQYKPWEK